MENALEITSVPVILALVYGVIELYKTVAVGEKYLRWIPIIAAGLGTILGIVCYYLIPGIIPASNVLVAILIGCASGLGATGAHQIFKQFTKSVVPPSDPEEPETEEKEDDKK